MANIMILNGSPRASRSNSKEYAELFRKEASAENGLLSRSFGRSRRGCARQMAGFSDVLLVFPPVRGQPSP